MASLTGSVVVRKASDTTIQSDDSLNNDADLVLPIGANETWYFEAMLLCYSSITPDIQLAFTVPAGATLSWIAFDGPPAGAAVAYGPTQASGTAITPGWGTNTSNRVAHITGVVVNGANAGNLQLQWAQGTSDAADTKVLATSFLMGAREA